MSFQIQGRTFQLRKDCIFNLKVMGISQGFSLYDREKKQYLCPDYHGNIQVEKGKSYFIRKVFIISNDIKDKKEKIKSNDDNSGKHSNKNNPYIQFGKDYRAQHPNEKIKVEVISEAWKQLDKKIKKEKYGSFSMSEENNNNKLSLPLPFNIDKKRKQENGDISNNVTSAKKIKNNDNKNKKEEDPIESFGSLFSDCD